MSEWSHGYNVEGGYTFGAYREIGPEWLDLSCRLNGFVPPERSKEFRYVEFGSGQGFGLCLLAACYPDAEFVGIDFNPEHIAHSRELARVGNLANVRFIEGDFAALAANWPSDLGQFQYATLHGIYSWIPAQVRRDLVRCLAHATAPGALVYASYNAMPSWAAVIPLQHVLRRLQVTTGASGVQAIQRGLKLFEGMDEHKARLSAAFPTLKGRVASAKTQNQSYLVQEYLHDNWHPLWLSQVVEEFADAKLSFVGTATLAENWAQGFLAEPLRKQLAEIADPILRAEVADCMINQGFRRDVFCRGRRREPVANQGLVKQPFMSIKAALDEAVKIQTTFGELTIKPEVAKAATEASMNDAKTMGDYAALPAFSNQKLPGVAQTISLLVQGGWLVPVRTGKVADANRFNAAIAREAAHNGAPYNYLAAPRAGSFLTLSFIEMLLLDTLFEIRKADADKLEAALNAGMAKQKRSFLLDGKPVTDPAVHAEQAKKNVANFMGRLHEFKKFGAIG